MVILKLHTWDHTPYLNIYRGAAMNEVNYRPKADYRPPEEGYGPPEGGYGPPSGGYSMPKSEYSIPDFKARID